jgi:cytochrome c
MGLAPALAAFANEPPTVSIHLGGNETFIWDRQPIAYIVVASDPEDGDSLAGSIDPYSIAVEFEYVAEGIESHEIAPADAGAVNGATRGKELVEGGDCFLCHSERASGPTAIPTYSAIAEKFQGNISVAPALAYNIVNGSQGIWGNMLMPAHAVTIEQATAMAQFVLSFASEDSARRFLPVSGSVMGDLDARVEAGPFGRFLPGRYVLSASYTDRGDAGGASAAGGAMHAFRYSNIPAGEADTIDGFSLETENGVEVWVSGAESASLGVSDVDLAGIANIGIATLGSSRRWAGGTVELRLDSTDGPLIGSLEVVHDSRQAEVGKAAARISGTAGKRDLFFVVKGGNVAIGALCFDCTY